MQLTVRNVSKALRTRLEERARRGGQSLNRATLDVLEKGLGITGLRQKKRDLSDIAGKVSSEDIAAMRNAVADLDAADLKNQQTRERRHAISARHQPAKRPARQRP